MSGWPVLGSGLTPRLVAGRYIASIQHHCVFSPLLPTPQLARPAREEAEEEAEKRPALPTSPWMLASVVLLHLLDVALGPSCDTSCHRPASAALICMHLVAFLESAVSRSVALAGFLPWLGGAALDAMHHAAPHGMLSHGRRQACSQHAVPWCSAGRGLRAARLLVCIWFCLASVPLLWSPPKPLPTQSDIDAVRGVWKARKKPRPYLALISLLWRHIDLSTKLLMAALLAAKCLRQAGWLIWPALMKFTIDTLAAPMSDASSMPACVGLTGYG